jgi:hypothetical protein
MRNTASPFTNHLLGLQGLLYCAEGGRRKRLPIYGSDGERQGGSGPGSINYPKTIVMSAAEILMMIKKLKSKANNKEWI